jgi:hypothetical protein
MDGFGRFSDPLRSTLIWDVGKPPSEARVVPGILHAHTAWRVRHAHDVGVPLSARHLDACTQLRHGDRLLLPELANVGCACDSGCSHDFVTVRELMCIVHACVNRPLHDAALRGVEPSYLRHFGSCAATTALEANQTHHRFVSLALRSWERGEDPDSVGTTCIPGIPAPRSWVLRLAVLPWL